MVVIVDVYWLLVSDCTYIRRALYDFVLVNLGRIFIIGAIWTRESCERLHFRSLSELECLGCFNTKT